MRTTRVFVCFGILLNFVCAKRFETRCKLVRELMKIGVPNDIFLGQWACLIEKSSDRTTDLLTVSTSGKKYYGLYQIPSKWCKETRKGGDCNITCSALLDDDIIIRDDTACAQKIFYMEGFKYWPKWVARCKNDNFITNEIYKCPDLMGTNPRSTSQTRETPPANIETAAPATLTWVQKYFS